MGLTPAVIGSHPDRAEWLTECLSRIPADRPLVVHEAGGYEIAALRTGCAHFDRFLFLHDSVTILDEQFWTVIDATPGPAWLTGGPPMYLGIHDRTQLAPVLATYPDEIDKRTSVQLEVDLPRRVNYGRIWPEIADHTALRQEHRHGRDNLVVGNHLWEKHKGTWR